MTSKFGCKKTIIKCTLENERICFDDLTKMKLFDISKSMDFNLIFPLGYYLPINLNAFLEYEIYNT